jgi:hypothetical protein
VLHNVALPSESVEVGSWDSIHVFEVQDTSRQAHYSLTSTILLWLGNQATTADGDGYVNLSGTTTRQVRDRVTAPWVSLNCSLAD